MEIRDKLFTEEQYLSQLKLYNEEILYYEQLHRSGKRIGYDSLFNFRLRSLLVQFSVGKNLEDLKGNYMEIIRIMPRFWTEKGFYIEMLWMLSIGIMLEYDDNTMQKLVQLIKDNDVKDYIYDTLIRYRFPDWTQTTGTVLYPLPYQAVIAVTELAKQDKIEAVKRLEKYLKKEWYRGHSDLSWYNDHKYGINHDGYWCFESEISPSEDAYSVLADIVNGEKRSPHMAFMYGYVYEKVCEYYGRIIYNAENLWQLDEQSSFIPIPLSDDFPYIISIPMSELEIKKQQYTALEAGNGIGDYDYEEEMDDLNFIFDEAIEARKDLIITVY